MLQAIRDRATGWIAWVIVILICIPFALWGVNEYFDGAADLTVARVNDTDIGYYQYRGALEQQRQQLRQMFGGNIPRGLVSDEVLREQALNRLIRDEVLVQQAVGSGIRVGDEQLATAIVELPMLQDGGQFSQPAYDQFLRARGTTAPGFELDLRRSMLAEQVVTALRRTAIVTPEEVDAALRLQNEQRRFRLLRIDADSIEVPEPSEDAIRARFEGNPQRYVQPEQVSVRYLELDREAIAADIVTDEAELRAIYDDRVSQGSYVTPEQREARHILITVAADASEDEVEKARETISALRARIEAGEDFAEVAKEASQDPGSASQGGSLGFFGRGVMDAAFEEAAFAQELDELGEPVRSRFGWHVIQVTQVQADKVRSFEDARADVLRQYQEAQASQVYAERAEQLANLAFENPESLEVAAEALDLSAKVSDFFSRGGEGAGGIAANPDARAAAFSDDVLNGGNNSELIELDGDRLVVLRVAERRESRPQTLDEVREEIAALLRDEARAERASALGNEILESLRGGASMEELAATHGLTWSEPEVASRQDSGAVDPVVAQALFRMPRPDAGRPSLEGVDLDGEGFALIALSEVTQPDDVNTAEARDRIAQRLESAYGEQTFGAVMDGLRDNTEVEIFESNFNPEGG